jgi:hypothetical protein
MARERDLLQNNLRKTMAATQKQADLVKINENTKKNLEVEIMGYKSEAQKQRKVTAPPSIRTAPYPSTPALLHCSALRLIPHPPPR